MGQSNSCCVDRKEQKDRLKHQRMPEPISPYDEYVAIERSNFAIRQSTVAPDINTSRVTYQPPPTDFNYQPQYANTISRSITKSYLSSSDKHATFTIVSMHFQSILNTLPDKIQVKEDQMSVDQIIQNPFRKGEMLVVYRAQTRPLAQLEEYTFSTEKTTKSYLDIKQLINQNMFVGCYTQDSQISIYMRRRQAGTELQMIEDCNATFIEDIINERRGDKLDCKGLVQLLQPRSQDDCHIMVLQQSEASSPQSGNIHVIELEASHLNATDYVGSISQKIESLCSNDVNS